MAENLCRVVNTTDIVLPYDRLFEGPRSEWVVAFGYEKPRKPALGTGQCVITIREKAPVDIRQYRSFNAFLETLDFNYAQMHGAKDTGLTVYTKDIKVPPNRHQHTLTVKVFNSTQLKDDAYFEFIKTNRERRGYFSISHSMSGEGLLIGGKPVRPEGLLKSPAPLLIVVPISCHSYKFFLGCMKTYLNKHRISEEKLIFFGTSQDIDIMQSKGAFAILKQTFESMLAYRNGLDILGDSAKVYNPIMPSYDPDSFKRNPKTLNMDKSIQAKPILRGWICGQAIKLPRTLKVLPV
jgi:hypothetical protein